MHKILLVEDDAVIRQMIKKMLEQWGYQVVAIEDLMQVLTTFVKEEPQLVLACPSLTVTIGARKFGRFRRCRLCFCLRETSLWISSWLSIWAQMTM